MEISEIKQHPEYPNFLEVKFKEIDRIFTIDIKRFNTLDEFKDKFSRKLRGHYRKKAQKELAKNYPTKEELKNQIKNLVGEEILPKEENE